jgi:hypothetical protein
MLKMSLYLIAGHIHGDHDSVDSVFGKIAIVI